jgi:hypothetical protein
VLTGLVLAWGAALSHGRWDLASAYLAEFQVKWDAFGQMVKQWALDRGADLAVVNRIPDEIPIGGALDVPTADVITAALYLMYGSPAHVADPTPTDATRVASWFATKVAPLAPTTDGHWVIWTATNDASAADIGAGLISQMADAYMYSGPRGVAALLSSVQAQRAAAARADASPPSSTPAAPARAGIPWWGWVAGASVAGGLLYALFFWDRKQGE